MSKPDSPHRPSPCAFVAHPPRRQQSRQTQATAQVVGSDKPSFAQRPYSRPPLSLWEHGSHTHTHVSVLLVQSEFNSAPPIIRFALSKYPPPSPRRRAPGRAPCLDTLVCVAAAYRVTSHDKDTANLVKASLSTCNHPPALKCVCANPHAS